MEYTSIPDYNDGSFNLYQNELMNFFIFLTKVHPAFILDKSLKAQCRQFVLSASLYPFSVRYFNGNFYLYSIFWNT